MTFEGATKRSKPRLQVPTGFYEPPPPTSLPFQVGDVVYARLTLSNKDMDPELSCTTTSGKANGMGKLEGGFLADCSLGLCRK